MIEPFTIESLATVADGSIAAAFALKLKECIDDLNDRPDVKAGRKLVVTVTLSPASLNKGALDSVNVGFEVDNKLPKLTSREINMANVRGGLAYNDLSADQVRQGTLDMVPRPQAATSDPQQSQPATSSAVTAAPVPTPEKTTNVV